jgi:hypothetical protein
VTPNRHGLDVYLRSVNEEIQTMKMSSELWFRSPSRRRIQENDRFVRSLISAGLGWATSSAPTARGEPAEPDPAPVWSAYWDAAAQTRDVAVHFGAAGHRTLGEYFTVDTGRSGEAARARRVTTAFSPADYLLRSIDRFCTVTGALPVESCRTIMGMLARDWSVLARTCRAQSGGPVLSASHLLHEFYNSIGARIAGQRGPEHPPTGPSADAQQALLTAAEARELATTYMLGRYSFTAQEYRMASSLVAMRRLRSALLAVHLQLTAESRKPLGRLVAEFGTSRVLLPFTEAFVNRHGYGSAPRLDLSPNPKLITVLCNNIVPAIAGELLRSGARVDDLDSGLVRAGIVAARRRHVFEVMIALFDRVGSPHLDIVALSGFSMRVCPAAVPVSAFLESWLPYHFDRFGS